MNPIEEMQEMMQACRVDPALIEQAVASAKSADLFGAPVVVGMTPTAASRWFDAQFWPNYPKRDGQNPKEPTRKLIVAAVGSGENPEQILAGLARLVHDLRRRNKVGTEFVPMAKTWVRAKGWKDDPHDPASTPRPQPSGGGFYAAAATIGRNSER